ncbi:hypothetical protein BD410DRAFT_828903 [Rickenella mellea]|uniref:Uncharacterized protein n=1 Tax=Rickenella mellea TaxID=50990 RepID=A0A4Y7Q354_9AGAM|nr:hypothetical protein BD410DRAFT_828903 [Rickenella mellea]
MLAKVKALLPVRIRRRIVIHINKLPVELLAEIFLWCNPIGTFPRPSRHLAPILLGRVCRVWRSVSLSTPQLWAQIVINIEYEEGNSRPQNSWNSRLFDEWLRRSGHCPLSFTIGRHYPVYHAPLTLKLHAEAHRWKTVSLETDCNYCIDDILRLLWIPGTTPMLTDLRFLHQSPFDIGIPIPVTIASQIISFHVVLPINSFSPNGGYHALRELRIGPCVTTQQYSLVFTQFPLLEILEIAAAFPLRENAKVVHTLQHLHTFIFVGDGLVAELWLLDLFDAPALHSLAISIDIYCGGEFQEWDRLSNFLVRCGGQLRRLMLKGNFICHELVELTRHTPILVSLCVEITTLIGDLTTLCPKLSQVDILDGHGDVMTAVSAILSRWEAGRLKERRSAVSPFGIRVPPRRLLEVLKLQNVKWCIQQGLRVGPLPSKDDFWWKSHILI